MTLPLHKEFTNNNGTIEFVRKLVLDVVVNWVKCYKYKSENMCTVVPYGLCSFYPNFYSSL